MATLAELIPSVSSQQMAIHWRTGYYVFYKGDGSLWVLDIDSKPPVEHLAESIEGLFALLGEIVVNDAHWVLVACSLS